MNEGWIKVENFINEDTTSGSTLWLYTDIED